MRTFIFLLLWQVEWIQAQAPTPQPKYQIPVSPVDIEATEPPIIHSVPFLPTQWDVAKPGAKYMAHLFAGKAEFSYVVRIEGNTWHPCLPPDEAVVRNVAGMLVTNTIVLTACRAVSIVFCKKQNDDAKQPWPKNPHDVPDFDHHIDLFPGAEHGSEKVLACDDEDLGIVAIRFDKFFVYYATVYIHEDNKLTDQFGYFTKDFHNRFQGKRGLEKVLLHPDCKTWETLENDVALVVMRQPINPLGTWIGFATFPMDEGGRIERMNLQYSKICYVAGFNNNYNGLYDNDQITKDYKCKFRVYPTSLDTCKKYTRIICMDKPPNLVMGCVKWQERIVRQRIRGEDHGIECWAPRNKVGAVCNLHSGAPLVCDGRYVHGFVLRAADEKRCNNMWPVPFYVARMYKFDKYFNAQLVVLTVPPDAVAVFDPQHQVIKKGDPHYELRGSSIRRSRNELLLQICVLNVLLRI